MDTQDRMMQKLWEDKARGLWAFAGGMLLLGLAFVLYDPTLGKVAFYAKAKTGLIACGVLALLSGIAAALTGKKGRPGWYMGLGLIFLTLIMMSGMALKRWKSTNVDQTKRYAAIVTSLAAVWSLVQFVSVARGAAGVAAAGDKEGE
jgi:hypothetical protein